MILLLILTPVVAAIALWLSRRRRRTLLQLSVGGLIGLVVIRRVVDSLSTSLIDTGNPANKSARRAILTHLFHQYFSISRWVLIGLIATFVIALITGPYGWAQSFRRVVTHYAQEGWNLAVAISGRAHDDRTIEWVRSHLDLLRIAGVVVGGAPAAHHLGVVGRFPDHRGPACRLRVVAAPRRPIQADPRNGAAAGFRAGRPSRRSPAHTERHGIPQAV